MVLKLRHDERYAYDNLVCKTDDVSFRELLNMVLEVFTALDFGGLGFFCHHKTKSKRASVHATSRKSCSHVTFP